MKFIWNTDYQWYDALCYPVTECCRTGFDSDGLKAVKIAVKNYCYWTGFDSDRNVSVSLKIVKKSKW